MNIDLLINEILQYPEKLDICTISNPKDKKSLIQRIQIRLIRLKNELVFHCSFFEAQKNTHRNIAIGEFHDFFKEQLLLFRQVFIRFHEKNVQVLIDKKGTPWIKTTACDKKAIPMHAHNEKKNYIIEENKPLDFLIRLGIMKSDGAIVPKRRDKFIQINRFLEVLSDVISGLPNKNEYTIVDLGCGKGYLTFALYWWFENVLKKSVQIFGVDSKKEVIESITELARATGYKNLSFVYKNIQEVDKPFDIVDCVIALHACDIATDFAIQKAISWNAESILVAPCCQHEISKILKKDSFQPFQKYPILREKFCALYTDIFRCEVLEKLGYKVSVLEFIDPEHTPKNLLIRATRSSQIKRTQNYVDILMHELEKDTKISQCLLEKKH